MSQWKSALKSKYYLNAYDSATNKYYNQRSKHDSAHYKNCPGNIVKSIASDKMNLSDKTSSTKTYNG